MTDEIAGLLAGPAAAVARGAGLAAPDVAAGGLTPCRGGVRGDVTSRVAFRIAADLPEGGAPPRRLGEEILAGLPECGDLLERVEVAGPGFLNFTVRRARWLRILAAVPANPAPGAAAPGGRDAPRRSAACDAAREALARIAGVFRAHAAAGGAPVAVEGLGSLELPEERELVRRSAILADFAASPAHAPCETLLGAVAQAFRDFDGRVRLVTADAAGTAARLALVAATGRALRLGLERVG